jgi:hypothetical protein
MSTSKLAIHMRCESKCSDKSVGLLVEVVSAGDDLLGLLNRVGDNVHRTLGSAFATSCRRAQRSAHADADVLDLEEFVEAVDAVGPAEAALFVAAIGPLRSDVTEGVDPHRTRFELTRDIVSGSWVWMNALSPNGVSFASLTACPSSVNSDQRNHRPECLHLSQIR